MIKAGTTITFEDKGEVTEILKAMNKFLEQNPNSNNKILVEFANIIDMIDWEWDWEW